MDECPVTKINSLDMLFFYELDNNGDNINESLEELSAFGDSKGEIVKYFNSHILKCGICKEMYNDYLHVREILDYFKV